MRKLLVVTAMIMGISGAAFAQGANNGGGVSGPEQQTRVNGALNTNPQGNAPGGSNGTISSNGTGTTATGGIDKGVGTTLSKTGTGGALGDESSSSK